MTDFLPVAQQVMSNIKRNIRQLSVKAFIKIGNFYGLSILLF